MFEESAAGRVSVGLAGASKDGDYFWIDESSVDHELITVEIDGSVIHDPVSDDDGFDVDFAAFCYVIMSIDENSQVRDVLAGVRLASDEEGPAFVF